MQQDFSDRDQTQLSVYTRWLNHHGEKAREPINVKDMANDLTSGEIMCLLSEVFVPGPNLKYTKDPKNKLTRTQNQSLALTRFEEDGAQLVNIHATTLADDSKNNLKVWMGLVFQLILRYSVGDYTSEMDSADAKKAKSLAELKRGLIDWVNSKLATLSPQERAAVRQFNNGDASDADIVVSNLEKDWQDGTALTGLCIALHPDDKRDNGLQKLREKAAQGGDNAALAATISRSTTNLGVPALMSEQELAEHPEGNAVLTYISAFKKAVYVDDEPAVEKAVINWDEPTFLQIEVEALEKKDFSVLTEQKEKIRDELNIYNEKKANGIEYDSSDDRKAIRMALHLRRVVAIVANADADAAANADKDAAAKKAQEDADAAAKKAQEDADAAAKKAEQDAAALEDEKKKKKQAEDQAQKLQEELDETKKALAKLQKRQSKLEELQKALLACAEISDQMMADEQTE